MGKVHINQLDKADILPFRCNRAYHLTTKYGSMWNLPKWDGYHKDEKHKWYWVIADDIAKNNIGKSFALAFSYYCKKVEKRYQYEFLEMFISKYRFYDKPNYIIDENGNIQIGYQRKKYKRNIIFESDDYKTEQVHKDTLHTINDFRAVFEKISKVYTRKLPDGTVLIREYNEHGKYLYSIHKNGYKAIDPDDFIYIIVSGWYKEFKSKSDPEYQRLINNRRRAKQKAYRHSISHFDQRTNELLLKEAKQKEKERQLNLIKIESNGFDELTSFRK